ncbi:MAG: hypothetical protein M1838_002672 [Thelocarpon superellum]|nr:MAG: hypothetical protein M1838_002672 [Thelocarpon superellum]
MAESPGSPLSSLPSDEFAEDGRTEDRDLNFDGLPDHRHDASTMPPLKRPRLAQAWDPTSSIPHAINDTETDISSDTSGDIPGSPTAVSWAHDEEAMGHEQVTVCHWDRCPAGDLGNMDSLVDHIHDDHIGTRQKKYACEWDDCSRKGMPHASGYALRAHMRSHTKEKPFFCQLPECDRCFTRSDALAKHMRTVHETEALRPSDPVPRNHSNPPPRLQRIKLILSSKPPDPGDEAAIEAEDDDRKILGPNDVNGRTPSTHAVEPYPADLQLTPEESLMPPRELFRLLRRQLRWAEEERQELQAEVEALEAQRKNEWVEKELLLENVMEAELAVHTSALGSDGQCAEPAVKLLPERDLPLIGPSPWYREKALEPAIKTLEPEEAMS